MTSKSARVIGALVGVLALLAGAKAGLDDRYVTRPEYSQLEAKLTRVLDLLCDGKPNARQCQ